MILLAIKAIETYLWYSKEFQASSHPRDDQFDS